MRVLLTGASGLLGKYLIARKPEGATITPTYFQHRLEAGIHLDLSEPESIYYAFNRAEPDVVLHLAGNADVDWCQKNPLKAETINVRGTQILCDAASEYSARVVYVSTNAVFDGEHAPYAEKDKCHPVNHYGEVKYRAEWAVRQYKGWWTIVRPILLYGWPPPWGRQNWASRVYNAVERGQDLRVVNDTVTQPTYAGWAADAIWRLVEGNHGGIYHLGGETVCTLFDFALECAKAWGANGASIVPASSDDFPTIAPRPRDTTYDLAKIRSIIEPIDIETGLAQMLEEHRGQSERMHLHT